MWPQAHQAFLDRALPLLKEDRRILGLGAGGSRLTGSVDEFCDLDLMVVVEPNFHAEILRERFDLARGLGGLLSGFSDEHMGVEDLFVCLFEDPLLHVNLNFLSLDEFRRNNGDVEILWERDKALSEASTERKTKPEPLNLQWFEDRFWVWIHYGAQRLGQGEIFETIDTLGFLRSRVLGPLLLQKAGAPAFGVRMVERHGGNYLSSLRATIPVYDARSCELSLREAAKLYVDLRETLAPVQLSRHRRAEMAAMRYLHDVSQRISEKSEERLSFL